MKGGAIIQMSNIIDIFDPPNKNPIVMWGGTEYGAKNKRLLSFYRIKSINQSHPAYSSASEFKSHIESIFNFSELIELTKKIFPKYFAERIIELKNLEPEEEISIESLKSMLLFLFSIKKFRKSAITLNDVGIFQARWKRSRNDSLTTSFIDNWSLNYVIFKPSRHASKRIILNGKMNVLDFKDYLVDIKFKPHKEQAIYE
jgi:hypothetical protein